MVSRGVVGEVRLKSVQGNYAYGRIAIMLQLLGQIGQLLGENDCCNLPNLLIPFWSVNPAIRKV